MTIKSYLTLFIFAVPAGFVTFAGMIILAGFLRQSIEVLPLQARLGLALGLLLIVATVVGLILIVLYRHNSPITAFIAGLTTALILLALRLSFNTGATFNPLIFGWPGMIGVIVCTVLGGWLSSHFWQQAIGAGGGATSVYLKSGLIVLSLLVLGISSVYGFSRQEIRKMQTMPDTHDLAVRINEMADDYVQNRKNAQLSIGIWQRGKTHTQSFAHPEDQPVRATAQSLYEIGSVTKVFTAILLAKMVEEGTVGLDDPIGTILPTSVTLTPEVAAITLRQLATHQSGLPRLPSNAFSTPGFDEQDPYAAYDSAALYVALSHVKVESRPGAKVSYSNFGVGLLGHLLSLASGQPYAKLLQEKVFEPLQLAQTTLVLSPAQREQLIPGYAPDGNPVPNWRFDVMAPAGGVCSSVTDMLRFVKANLNPQMSTLGSALSATHATQVEESARRKVGLGWQISTTETGLTILWHNGGTGGYVSFVGFDAQNQNGVVLLSNYGDAMAGDDSLDKLALRILEVAARVSLS